MKKFEYLIIYLKGILMGICDLIPGISGGTIAFISGIYERLINAVKNINFKNYFSLLKDFKMKKIIELDIIFLIVLFLGIISAIISGSHLISYLLNNYFVYIMSFFIGLIIASTKIIFDEIKSHKFNNFFFMILAIIIFLPIFLMNNTNLGINVFTIFLAGFLAIFAMFLPGVSGSYILLVLGLYEQIIDAVKSLDIVFLIPFILGAIIGVLIVSRMISYLFHIAKSKTLYFLLGLVIVSLIVPIRKILEITDLLFINYLIMFILFLLGVGIVLLFSRFKK